MKYLISLMTAAVPALFATPMPEGAQLLASNTVVAHYLDVLELPCRHLTADCPDKCNHATRVARFRVVKNEAYNQADKYGDDKITPGSIMMVDIKNPTPGQDDKAVAELIASLRAGDTVRLTQEHRYGQIGDCVTPFRPITAAEKVEKKPAVPATPAAPAGDYSTMPL